MTSSNLNSDFILKDIAKTYVEVKMWGSRNLSI